MGNRKRLPRKPTSMDVARAVGVSQSAVSRAFTEGGKVAKKTRERILKVADKIGYVPNIHARSLITRRTGMIALVMGDITNPFYPEVLEILASKLQTAGKRVVLFSVSRDEPIDQALAGVLKYQVDGLVIASALPGLSIAELNARAHAPVVLFNRTVQSAPVDSVCCDNFSGARSWLMFSWIRAIGASRSSRDWMARPRASSASEASARAPSPGRAKHL